MVTAIWILCAAAALALILRIFQLRKIDAPYVVLVRRFGKPCRLVRPGQLGWRVRLLEQFSQPIKIEVRTLNQDIEIRTADGSYAVLPVSMQLKVFVEEYLVWSYTNKLADPEVTILEMMKGVLFAAAAQQTFDQLFDAQQHLNALLQEKLNECLRPFAYEVSGLHISTPVPDPAVRRALSDRTAARYQLEATQMLARGEQASAEAYGAALGAMVATLKESGMDDATAIALARKALEENVTSKFAHGNSTGLFLR